MTSVTRLSLEKKSFYTSSFSTGRLPPLVWYLSKNNLSEVAAEPGPDTVIIGGAPGEESCGFRAEYLRNPLWASPFSEVALDWIISRREEASESPGCYWELYLSRTAARIGPGVKDEHSHVLYAFSECLFVWKEDFGIREWIILNDRTGGVEVIVALDVTFLEGE